MKDNRLKGVDAVGSIKTLTDAKLDVIKAISTNNPVNAASGITKQYGEILKTALSDNLYGGGVVI